MARPKKEQVIAGRLSIDDMRKMINKKAGEELAFNLEEDNPVEVTDWIPTGSHILDCILTKGKKTGIPIGRFTELAGLSAVGKSFMAAKIAANAQQMGLDVVYFDAESALDPEFLRKAGCDVEKILYVQAKSVEFVLQTVEDLLGSNENRMLFILDSYAATPCDAELEGSYNPNESIALKPRIMSLGLRKLTQLLGNKQGTMIITNHLKTNIPRPGDPSARIEVMMNPFVAPGGVTVPYYYSHRLWLTGRKSKASYITNEAGYRIGSETKITLKKSRFGTEGRECSVKLVWGGDEVVFLDEEVYPDIISKSEHVTSGAWWTLRYEDGTEQRFRSSALHEEMKNEKFRKRILWIVEDELVTKFDKQIGDASNFYNIEQDETEAAVAV